MRDRTKQLLVINTGEKKQSGSGSQTIINQYSSYAGGSGVDLRDYLLKRIWDTAWELRTTEEGESYIFCKLPFISQHGVTLYADGGNIDLPSLYAGIPVDGTTITKNDDGKLMLNPNLELGGLDEEALQKYLDDYKYAKITDVDNRINDLVNGAPAAYDTLKEIADVLQGNVNSIGDIITTLGTKADLTELDKYLPLKGGTLTGHITLPNKIYIRTESNSYAILGMDGNKYILAAPNKPTTIRSNGTLKHNSNTIWDSGNLPIIYDAEEGYWKLTGNLLVTGGITQYVVDELDIPSIIDSLPIAGYEVKGIASFSDQYFTISAEGKVSIIPDSVGLNEGELIEWLANSDYATKTYVGGQLESYALQSALTATNNTLATKWTQDDTKIANWDTAYGWGNHASAGYFLASNFTKVNIVAKLGISDWALAATKPSYTTKEVTEDTNLYFTNQRAIDALTETLKAYVTLKGTQTIEGEKDFTGGLKVNGSPIVYDSENGYWLLQGNLLITGGLTQYVDDGSVDLPNLYDGLPIDRDTIYWEETTNGKVLKAKVAEGGIASITKDMVVEALGFTPYDASNPNGYITSAALNGYATQTWVNQQGFLTEHQDLSGYQTKITSTNKLAYSLISGTPDLSVYLTTSSASSTYQPKITSSAKLAVSLVSGLATVATSGSYNDLSNKPTIPTSLKNPYALSWSGYSSGSYDGSSAQSITIPSNTNQLTNGAGFITSSASITGNAATASLIKPTSGTYQASTWNPLTSYTKIWGEAFINSAITSDSGDMIFYLRPSIYNSGTTELCVAIDGDFYAQTGTKKVWHEGNFTPSNYLPLSGGTLRGRLYILHDNDTPLVLIGTTSSWIHFTDSFQNSLGYIGFNASAEPAIYKGSNAYKIWHSGNDGSGSGLDADLLDGLDSSVFIRRGVNNGFDNQVGNRIITITGSTSSPITPGSTSYGAILQWSSTDTILPNTAGNSNWYYQLIGQTNMLNPSFRSRTNGNAWSEAKVLAFTTDNVASATKLQTTRTIWGQSFDGTGDVNGTMLLNVGSVLAYYDENAKMYREFIRPTSGVPGGANLIIGRYNADYDYTLSLCGKSMVMYTGSWGSASMYINSSGNVGIGTTSPAYKLEVAGTGEILNINNTSGGDSGIRFSRGSNTSWTIIAQGGNLIIKDNYSNSVRATFYEVTQGGTISVASNFLAAGGITQYSDIRKKTKLNDVELTLKQVANAPLIEHYYNSDDKKTTHVGSIAQYWAEMNDWFCKLDSDGYYTMEIQNAALASAISVARELERYESKTDKKIRMLKKRINELEDEIEKLKK